MKRAAARSIWIGIWMLSAFIVTASLDGIPDPPAVKSPTIEVKARSLDCQLESSPAEALTTHSFRSGPRVAARWIALRQVLDARIPADRIAMVRLAADPSPPLFQA
jgi:hypothetical protein